MKGRDLSKKAEDLAWFAIEAKIFFGRKKTKPGETFLRWKRKNPGVDATKFRAEHFNHRLD